MVRLDDVEAANQHLQAGQAEEQGLAYRAAPLLVQREQRRYAVVGDLVIHSEPGTLPPVHRVYMDVGVLGKPPGQLEVAEFLAATVVGVDRVRDEGYDWLAVVCHRAHFVVAGQSARKSMDSAGLAR